MNQEQKDVRDFHEKFNCLIQNKPTMPDVETLLLRVRLLIEETAEIATSSSQQDIVEIVDGLCDLLYVTYGFGVVLGVDLAPIFQEVQRSNMSKIPSHDIGGKVLKGEDWQPPNIIKKLKEQGWDE